MSVKEKFEQAYENIIESCPGDILEGFDFLLDECERLEKENKLLRKRMAAVEKENNVLRIFYSENKSTPADAEELEAMAGDIEDASNVLDRIKDILVNASSIMTELASSASKSLELGNECENVLAENAFLESVPEEKEDACVPVAKKYVQVPDDDENDSDEEIVEEIGEESESNDTDTVKRGDVAEKAKNDKNDVSQNADITERLRLMLESDGDGKTDASDDSADLTEKKDAADDDISSLILKVLSENVNVSGNVQISIEEDDDEKTDAPEEKPLSAKEARAHRKEERMKEKAEKKNAKANVKADTSEPERPTPSREPHTDKSKEKDKGKDKVKDKKKSHSPEPSAKTEDKSGGKLIVEERKQIKDEEPEEQVDLRTIKDSLARIKNKRKGL